jgi:hypothetical protein
MDRRLELVGGVTGAVGVAVLCCTCSPSSSPPAPLDAPAPQQRVVVVEKPVADTSGGASAVAAPHAKKFFRQTTEDLEQELLQRRKAKASKIPQPEPEPEPRNMDADADGTGGSGIAKGSLSRAPRPMPRIASGVSLMDLVSAASQPEPEPEPEPERYKEPKRGRRRVRSLSESDFASPREVEPRPRMQPLVQPAKVAASELAAMGHPVSEPFSNRADPGFGVGDLVRIIKKGSQQGKVATVINPEWGAAVDGLTAEARAGRVKVEMVSTSEIKSYLRSELQPLADGEALELLQLDDAREVSDGSDGGTPGAARRTKSERHIENSYKAAFAGFRSASEIEDVGEIEIQRLLSRGTSGTVSAARWRGMDVAVKQFFYVENARDGAVESFENEVFLMREVSHPASLYYRYNVTCVSMVMESNGAGGVGRPDRSTACACGPCSCSTRT